MEVQFGQSWRLSYKVGVFTKMSTEVFTKHQLFIVSHKSLSWTFHANIQKDLCPNPQKVFKCDSEDQTSAIILLSLGAMGIGANAFLMAVLLSRAPLRR